MFLHNLKYEFLQNIRAKSLILWLILFPIILGTFFKVAFSGIYETTTVFSVVPVAVVEKGSNENHNKMIRRFFPKGTDFSKVTKKQVAAVQNWMNNYPRKILDWMTPLEAEAKLIA